MDSATHFESRIQSPHSSFFNSLQPSLKILQTLESWTTAYLQASVNLYQNAKKEYLANPDATPILELSSKRIYSYVRKTPEVPFFDENFLKAAEWEALEEREDDTSFHSMGSMITAVYEAMRSGALCAVQHINLASLHAINRFKIADNFATNEEATFDQISSKCGLRESDTRQLLQHAMRNHVFQEPRPGIVAHTAASKVLSELPLMSQWVGMVCDELWPAASRIVDAMTRWPNSDEPNETGFNIAHNTDLPLYNEIAKDSYHAKRFADGMTLFASGQGFEPSYLINNYDFESFGTGTVVDIGGSHGIVSVELVRKYTNLHCVVQDFANVINEGKNKLPRDLTHRITFMEHNFFDIQPVKGAGVYIFRWVFHNWGDQYAIKILRSLVPALKRGAKVVINDFCLPDPELLPALMERNIRTFDLAMLEFHNGKERDAYDWAVLFQNAHKDFVFTQVNVPPGSKSAIIEALWQGD